MHVMCHMHYYAERPDGERVMFFMYVTRNLSIYNHLDQEGRRITICPVGAIS